MQKTQPVIYIVVPCYNEEEVLPQTAKVLAEKLYSLISSDEIYGGGNFPWQQNIFRRRRIF